MRMIEIQPGANRTFALLYVDRIIDIHFPDCQVGISPIGIEHAFPLRNIRNFLSKGSMREIGPHIDWRGKCRRRRCLERKLMMPPLITHHEINAIQGQLRRIAHGVIPAQPSVANDDFPLRQNPVQPFAVTAFMTVH